MRILNAKVQNFGSYQSLEFNFSSLGLVLVLGATGAGKSTLQDIPPWVLYGVTAKDGNADEVRNWNNLDTPTVGTLEVETPNGNITVTRSRGKGSNNDLYWTESGSSESNRGKDIPDTQKRLCARLGVDSDTYLQATYFHEFSPASTFFTAKAKDRRKLFESLADLEFPTELGARAGDERKTTKSRLDGVRAEEQAANSLRSSQSLSLADSISRKQGWDVSRENRIAELQQRARSFEAEKAEKVRRLKEQHKAFEEYKANEIEDLSLMLSQLPESPPESDILATIDELKRQDICKECGALSPQVTEDIQALQGALHASQSDRARRQELELRLKEEKNRRSPYYTLAMDAEKAESPYERQLQDESGKSNPFEEQVVKFRKQAEEADALASALSQESKALAHQVLSYTQLIDLAAALRAELLQNAVSRMEDQTNDYLTRFFESEFRVGFTLNGVDDLDVTIQKNGNDCVYRQLSRGQRQMLKLAFVISVMRASADRSGNHFSLLCFDESLFGLDPDLKVKAYRLFEELSQSHESVICVEHDRDFQNMFERRFLVSLVGDTSELEEING